MNIIVIMFIEFKEVTTVDISTYDCYSILDLVKKYGDTYLEFRIINKDKVGFGSGATREVYHQAALDMNGKILTRIDNHFVDINADDQYFKKEIYAGKYLAYFFAMFLRSGCILPYHLSPLIIESLIERRLEEAELEYFLEKMDNELYHKLIESKKYFDELGLECTYNQYLREHVIENILHKKIPIYQQVAYHLKCGKYSAIELDRILSGSYLITSDMVISIMTIGGEYREFWHNFICLLNQEELKQMLVTFGNTISLNKNYTIEISEIITEDIKVYTCLDHIILHARLFEDFKNLKNLRHYFSSADRTIIDKDRLSSSNFTRPRSMAITRSLRITEDGTRVLANMCQPIRIMPNPNIQEADGLFIGISSFIWASKKYFQSKNILRHIKFRRHNYI